MGDFITINDERHFRVIRNAFEAWVSEGCFGLDDDLSNKDIKEVLARLGLHSILEEIEIPEIVPADPFELYSEEPIVPLSIRSVEDLDSDGVPDVSRAPNYHGPKY